MATRLGRLIDALEARRSLLLAQLDRLDAATLAARPAPDKWSILEIAEHLVVAEKVILLGLPPWAALAERSRSPRHRLLYLLVWTILRFRIPVRVPSRRMHPGGQACLPELRADWEATGRWLRAYQAEYDPDGRRRAVFQHPVAGPITLVQALRLDLLHLRVHERQIRRILRGAGPRATAGVHP